VSATGSESVQEGVADDQVWQEHTAIGVYWLSY
jgi:hypothetical protein